MYSKNDVDCEQCIYAANGGETVVCCYYGSDDCDPFGQCSPFELKEPIEMNINDNEQIKQTPPVPRA